MRTDRLVTEVLGGDMALTPADILGKRFHRALFGGYPNVEVDAFLERVADVLEAVIRENRELKDRIEEYKNKSEEYNQMQETLRSALATSQKFGENVIESARKEAEIIISTGRIEGEKLRIQAAKLPVALAQEINQLQQQRDRLRKDMNALLATHRTLLDSLNTAEAATGIGGDETVFFGIHPEAGNAPQPKSENVFFEPVTDETSDSEEEFNL